MVSSFRFSETPRQTPASTRAQLPPLPASAPRVGPLLTVDEPDIDTWACPWLTLECTLDVARSVGFEKSVHDSVGFRMFSLP